MASNQESELSRGGAIWLLAFCGLSLATSKISNPGSVLSTPEVKKFCSSNPGIRGVYRLVFVFVFSECFNTNQFAINFIAFLTVHFIKVTHVV
jgi:hypothetical protein